MTFAMSNLQGKPLPRIQKYVLLALGAAALFLLFMFGIPHLFFGPTMVGLQHKVEKKWVGNMAWEHGNVDAFQKVFGKPERLEKEFAGNFQALIYKCSDGTLVILADRLSQSTGRLDAMEIREFVRISNDRNIPPVLYLFHGDQVMYLPVDVVMTKLGKISHK